MWSEDVLLKTAERVGITPILSKGKNATRTHVSSNISSKKPKFIFLNGHGTSTTVEGQDNEPIIVLGENDDLLNDKIVHVIACDCGRELGRNCNAKAFIGYIGKFWLCMDKFSLSRPLQDELAGPTLKSALEVPDQLLKGKTPREAFELSQNLYQYWIEEFTHSESKYTTEELQLILPVLNINKTFQILYE